ncbi:MAG: DoxX family protein [Alphaproteobacteria bacterium]|nr:DoxX family protein [Alphaproteobacteria bacterium]
MDPIKALTQDRTVDLNTAPYAITALRVALGIMFLAHSVYLKAMVFTLPGTAQFFESLGLPGFSAYLVFAVEAIAGVLLILGYKTRLVALATVPVLLGATWAHVPAGWLFSAQGGGWEYPAFLVVAALVQAGLGAGAFALGTAKTNVQPQPVNA